LAQAFGGPDGESNCYFLFYKMMLEWRDLVNMITWGNDRANY